MVIKLRKFSRNLYVKVVASILVAALLALGFVELVWICNIPGVSGEMLFVQDYRQSVGYYKGFASVLREIEWAVENQKEDTLKRLSEEGALYWVELSSLDTAEGSQQKRLVSNIESSEIEKSMNALYHYEDGKERWTKDGKEWWTSTEILESHGVNPKEKTWYYSQSPAIVKYEVNNAKITFEPSVVEQQSENWTKTRTELFDGIRKIAILIGIAMLLSIYLMLVAGRRPEDEKGSAVHLHRFDQAFSDVQVIAIGLIVAIGLIFGGLPLAYGYGVNSEGSVFAYCVIGVCAFLLFFALGILCLSLWRKIKARTILKQTLIYVVLRQVIILIRKRRGDRNYDVFAHTKRLFMHQIIFTIITIIVIGLNVVLALMSMSVVFSTILTVDLIYLGVLGWYFLSSTKSFKQINKGIDESVQEKMKSEKMKIALVTNVSHDLKTPLTSIISYVDLLSKENLSQPSADYVSILAQKSEQLKNIVSDLFELSKVTSGDIGVELEKLDLKKLVEQTLADHNDVITVSGLDFRVALTENPVYIMGDGKKLYRVMQNILSNAMKYSMPNTRVYISIEIQDTVASVIVKNTSAMEITFTAEEVLQRFYRGDKARTSEGSGLGLSIAQGFTQACGGNFNVDIDGDLFKVTISFETTE